MDSTDRGRSPMGEHREIADWLCGLALQQYEQVFRDNAVDADTLPHLNEADLEKLGVLLGHRKKMLAALAALRGPAAETEVPVARQSETSDREGAERRQLTVMFCDLVGSTRLATQLDPEDLREVLRIYQRCIKDIVVGLGGYVARYLGDGIMIYFGYPEAQEDDAERAVRAGLNIVAAVGALSFAFGKLSMRVGIATGLVVVGELVGGPDAKEHDVIGETPNLAARLEALAAPDTVLIAASTRRLVGNLFEFRDLGAVDIKGFSEKIAIWQPLRPSAVDSRFEALRAASLTPLVGREAEIESLVRLWARARDGEGQIVLLTGEPGIGKSRVVAAFRDLLRGQPHIRLRLSCSPHRRDSTLHPVIAHLERAAGFAREDAPHIKLDKLEAMLAQSGESLPQTPALFADLLGLAAAGRYPPLTLDPQDKRERTLAAFLHQFEGLTRQQPVLLVFEDVHWIDSSSLELLQLLVERTPSLRMMALITCRPEFEAPWSGQAPVSVLSLSRLDQNQAAELVSKVTGNKALPADILERIIERTDGVPLFIEELTKSLLEGGFLREQDGRYVLDGPLPPLAIPFSLRALLLARLDRLSSIKEVAQIGAAVGRVFSYELLAAVARQSDDRLQRALEQLADSGLILCRGVPPDASFTFKHALVQDAAYSTLLRGRRRELHARIGRALEERFPETAATAPEVLAHHYTEAGDADRAIAYWRKAGEGALRRSANVEGITHLTRAIELTRALPESPERCRTELDLHLALGRMMRASKGYAAPETLRVFSRTRDLLDEGATLNDQIAVLYGLCIGHYVRAEHAAAQEVARQCLALASGQGNSETQAFANMLTGHLLWALGEFGEARAHLERALARSGVAAGGGDGRGSGNNVVTALSYLAWTLWPLGYAAEATASADDAVVRARGIGHVPLTAYALTAYAMYVEVFRASGFAAQSRRSAADEALAYCVEHRVTAYEPWARFCRGLALARGRDPMAGIAIMHAAIDAAQKINAEIFRPLHLGHLATAYAHSGQPRIGLGLLNDAIQTAEATGGRFFEAELHRLRGELLLALGEREEGQAEVERALAVARRQQARLWELRAATRLARIWRCQGKTGEVGDLMRPICRWFAEDLDVPDLRDARSLLYERA